MYTGGFCSRRRQDGSWDGSGLYSADYVRDAATDAGHEGLAANRPPGRGCMHGAESEFWKGRPNQITTEHVERNPARQLSANLRDGARRISVNVVEAAGVTTRVSRSVIYLDVFERAWGVVVFDAPGGGPPRVAQLASEQSAAWGFVLNLARGGSFRAAGNWKLRRPRRNCQWFRCVMWDGNCHCRPVWTLRTRLRFRICRPQEVSYAPPQLLSR
jgi:hypothetical protein